MKRIYNFSSGPAILPVPVLKKAADGILELGGSGMSVLELSHRGPAYEKIHRECRARLLKAMELKESEYTVLLLGGGASLQFDSVPMNFLRSDQSADFINTGEWPTRAIAEAKRFGKVRVIASSQDTQFSYIPKVEGISPDARYLHLCTNNTIEGTAFTSLPDAGSVPIVADMSSELLSRHWDYSRFSLIYAGAQKNLGPAGVTAVVIRNSFLATARDDVPTLLSYSVHAKADGLYNTPPAYAVYVMGLVLEWIEEQGGVAALQSLNERKAQVIYQALDEFPDVFDVACRDRRDRSMMNICFRLRDANREQSFLSQAEALGMDGLKGHRSVGGLRASIYNAFPEEGCVQLSELLRKFAKSGS